MVEITIYLTRGKPLVVKLEGQNLMTMLEDYANGVYVLTLVLNTGITTHVNRDHIVRMELHDDDA